MINKEMRKNLDAYEEKKDDLERNHSGKIAVMHNGELVDIYNDEQDAYKSACARFGLGKFVIKQIGKKPISLGIYTICVAR